MCCYEVVVLYIFMLMLWLFAAIYFYLATFDGEKRL